jgi:hypothetical protein
MDLYIYIEGSILNSSLFWTPRNTKIKFEFWPKFIIIAA